MRAVDLIQKKRDGQELTSSEIEWLIEGYVSGTVPDLSDVCLCYGCLF
ncbi:thymidine phosphorylase [Streptococcus pneumoniae]|nr:thymidine phosphorylase [Streptococcus pneumoniae]